MVQLDITDPANPGATAWRMEYVLREFPNKEPVSFWWKYPLHEINEALDDVQIETSQTKAERSREKTRQEKLKQQIKDTHAAVKEIADDDGKFLATQFMKAYAVYEDISLPTARKRLQQAGYEAEAPERNGLPSYWKKT